MLTATKERSLSELVSFNPSTISIEPDAVETRIRRKYLSASTMNELAGKCAGKWAVNSLLPRDDDPWSPAGSGTLAHAALEDFYNLPEHQRTQRMLYQLLQDQAIRAISKITGSNVAYALKRWQMGRAVHAPEVGKPPLGFTDEEIGPAVHPGRDIIGEAFVETDELTDHLWALACGIYDIEKPRTVNQVGSEIKLDGVMVDGVPVSGYIDRVDELPGGTVKIVDFKTGAKVRGISDFRGWRPDARYQMQVYAVAFAEMTGREVSAASLYFTRLGKEIEVDVTPRALRKVRRELTGAWQMHNNYADAATYPLKTSPLCGWCPLVELCPAAAEAGITLSERAEITPLDPEKEKMPSGADLLEASQARPEDITGSTSASNAVGADSGHSPVENTETRRHAVTKKKTKETTMATARRDKITDEFPPYIAEDDEGNLEHNSWAANNLYRMYITADRLVAQSELSDDDADFLFELLVNTVASACEINGSTANPQAGLFTRFANTLTEYAFTNNPAGVEDVEQWMDDAIAHLCDRFDKVSEKYLELASEEDE